MIRQILLVTALFAACASTARAQDVAITNVNVIPMDRARVLRDHVVIVSDGAIVAVGPRASVRIPANAARIDGQGGFLLPGLSDFHVHLRLDTDPGAYLAWGVTSLADMGSAVARGLRDSIRAGRLAGGQVFAGYFVDGPGGQRAVTTVAAARAAVVAADSLRFDFIKVYNSLTAEQLSAIMEESKRRRIAVVGHGVRAVGLERGFAAGQVLVAHAEEFMYTELQNRIRDENIAEVVTFTKRHGAYVVPNLSAYEAMSLQWGKPAVLEQFLERPEARFMPAYWIENWRGRDYIRRNGSIADRYEFLKRLTLALQRAGVPLITGTDSPGIPGMVAGASVHDDLRTLVEAGLTPFEALTAATRTPGEFAARHLGATRPFGTIAVGHRADFVLVARNPLDDITSLRRPLAVMAAGQWYDAARLAQLLQAWKATPSP